MRDRRHRTDHPIDEASGGAGDLHESVFGMRWSHLAGHGRCRRCRRPVRAGEAVLVLGEGEVYCVLCGRGYCATS